MPPLLTNSVIFVSIVLVLLVQPENTCNAGVWGECSYTVPAGQH